MKKVMAAMIFSVVILMAMSPAFAAEQTYGQLLYGLGVITGDTSGNLHEGEAIKREEMMAILLKFSATNQTADQNGSSEGSQNGSGIQTFTDVPKSHWAYGLIEQAYASGLTAGMGDGTFGLGQQINYNQAALFLLKSIGYSTEGIAYETAAETISAQYGIGLDTATDGSQKLTRGNVFELLSKGLYQAAQASPELIENTFGKEKADAFIAAYPEAVPAVVTAPESDGQSAGDAEKPNDYTFAVKQAVTYQNSDFGDDQSAQDYQSYLSEAAAMKTYVSKYLKDNTYSVVSLEDAATVIMKSSNPLRFKATTMEQFDKVYGVVNEITYRVSKSGNLTGSVVSYFGYADPTGTVVELRKYHTVDGMTPYVVLFEEAHMNYDTGLEEMWQGYVSCTIDDATGNIREVIGNSSFGMGYAQY